MSASKPLTPEDVMFADDGCHYDVGGLLLKVRGDSASWVFRYTSLSGDKRPEMGLGKALCASRSQAAASLESARCATAAARDLLGRGIDPLSAKRELEVARRREVAERRAKRLTLAQAARRYHERAVEPVRTDKHAAQWIASLENHIPAQLWSAPIEEICKNGRALVKAVLSIQSDARATRVTNMRETKDRIFDRLDSVFDYSCVEGWCTENPVPAMKRYFKSHLGDKTSENFRALHWQQAPKFAHAVDSDGSISARALEFLLLTAARTGEVLGAEWSDIDLDKALWTIPPEKMKNRRQHVVPLSQQALRALRSLPEPRARFVFQSAVCEGQALSNAAMSSWLRKNGLIDQTTVHGLRATFSTWANETASARPDVIEACLAHLERDDVRRAYNHAEYRAERSALLQAWADYLLPRPKVFNHESGSLLVFTGGA